MEEARRLDKPRVQGTSAACRKAKVATRTVEASEGRSARPKLRQSICSDGTEAPSGHPCGVPAEAAVRACRGPTTRKGGGTGEHGKREGEREREISREDTQREGAACFGAGGRVSSALAQTIAAEGKVGSMI